VLLLNVSLIWYGVIAFVSQFVEGIASEIALEATVFVGISGIVAARVFILAKF
jgi:hypothetical protein